MIGVLSRMPSESDVIASLRDLARLLRTKAPPRDLSRAADATAALMAAYVATQKRSASPEIIAALDDVEKAKSENPLTTVN